MKTRRTLAALALLGTTLSLTGALAFSPASALGATSPFCKTAGQLPITIAHFGPTASPAIVATVLKRDSAANVVALRLLANDTSGARALTLSRSIQYNTDAAALAATKAASYATALAANPSSTTAIKAMKGYAKNSVAFAEQYGRLLVTLHQTQAKVCPNIHPIVTTATTNGATTTTKAGGSTATTIKPCPNATTVVECTTTTTRPCPAAVDPLCSNPTTTVPSTTTTTVPATSTTTSTVPATSTTTSTVPATSTTTSTVPPFST